MIVVVVGCEGSVGGGEGGMVPDGADSAGTEGADVDCGSNAGVVGA